MPKVCPVCATSYADTNVFCPADGTTLRAADSDGDLVGSVVADRYLVTDLLGEGGMGKVYLARHVRLPLQAAIKVLRPELLKDPASVARFNREAANASRIEHERVARGFDFGETGDGLVYLAMEYVPGKTLKGVLEAEGALSLKRTATLIRQVADGLDAAHRMSIVHRDLKPDNILVTQDENGADKCKVVDFGIAKAIGGSEKEAGLTRTGFVVGTPEFMSPEQLLGGDIDHRSDVYALALVAYTCLTLDLPFDRNTPDRGMTARLMSAPRPLVVVRADLRWPDALQAVLDQALERDPTKRTASAGAFAKALEIAITTPVARITPQPVAIAPPSASSAPHLSPSTPGAARQISTIPRDESKRQPQRNNQPRVAAQTPSRPAKVAAPVAAETEEYAVPVGRRGFGWPRLRLPSLGLILLLGAGWWFVTKQRAPRPSDVNKLVNSVGGAAEQLIDGATGMASNTAGAASGAAVAAQRAVVSPSAEAPTAAPDPSSASPAPSVAPVGAPVPVATPRPLTANSAGGTSGRRTLDSLTKVLDPETADAAVVRTAVPALRALLGRLTSVDDSTWAYIRIAEAHLLIDEVRPACAALRSAQAVARNMTQAEVITGYPGRLGCSP